MSSRRFLPSRQPTAVVGVSGPVAVSVGGVWPAWRVVPPAADAVRVTGLPPGRVRLQRWTLPPAEAAVSRQVAGVRAEGLLPDGVGGDTAAGVVDAGHRVWAAGVSDAARGGVDGPVADAATGLAAVLASELGLGAAGRARLDAGVLLIAAAGGTASLVRVDAEGPSEAVVIDLGDGGTGGVAAAIAGGSGRLQGGFAAVTGVGEARDDPRAGGAPLASWLPAEEAFAPLIAAGATLGGSGWLAAGAAGAAAAGALPVPGGAEDADSADSRGAPGRGWWAMAAAAVVLGAGLLAWADLSAAARLDDALDARPGLEAAEVQLAADDRLYRWLESGGPTPLAVLDEVTSLLDGVVPAKLGVSADKVELEGSVDEAGKIDELAARLAGAKTITAVRVQRSQRVSDREFSYSIEAEPVERFYEAFVPAAEPDVDVKESAQGEPPPGEGADG